MKNIPLNILFNLLVFYSLAKALKAALYTNINRQDEEKLLPIENLGNSTPENKQNLVLSQVEAVLLELGVEDHDEIIANFAVKNRTGTDLVQMITPFQVPNQIDNTNQVEKNDHDQIQSEVHRISKDALFLDFEAELKDGVKKITEKAQADQ